MIILTTRLTTRLYQILTLPDFLHSCKNQGRVGSLKTGKQSRDLADSKCRSSPSGHFIWFLIYYSDFVGRLTAFIKFYLETIDLIYDFIKGWDLTKKHFLLHI